MESARSASNRVFAQKAPSAWTIRTPRQGSSSQRRRHFRVFAPHPVSPPTEGGGGTQVTGAWNDLTLANNIIYN
ncbi:hypothetical protein, partial [Streptomyces sp. WM6386]|uniref:hypothetical protein n=1 Tax=Streptomyces sp. WM6386 TaxID=1415558 RepID=UPI001F3DE416